MNLTKNAANTIAIAIIMLMASVAVMANVTDMTANAQTLSQPMPGALPAGVTPSVTVNPTAYLAVNPNPVGVGQQLLVNIWNQPPINVARDFVNTHQVTITKPDGTTETIGPITSYAGDSTAWFTYVPTIVGTYKFRYDFLGEYYPAGYYYQGKVVANGTSGATFLDSAYYKPASSREVSITVQQNMVASYPQLHFLPTTGHDQFLQTTENGM